MKINQITHNPTVIPELIARYEAVLKSDRFSFYYKSKEDQNKEIQTKIAELRGIYKKQNKQVHG